MGKPVTVDSDDLEVLLLASAGARKIEDIIASVKDDPAVMRTKGRIGEVSDRINRLRAEAIKDPLDRDPSYDEPPTSMEVKQLKSLAAAGGRAIVADATDWTSLRMKALVVMGHAHELTDWGDKTRDAVADDRLRVKLTTRGYAWANENGYDLVPGEVRTIRIIGGPHG